MMMIIIILTASYIGDDVRIVYSLANTMRSFSVTDGRTNEQGDSRSRIPSRASLCVFILQPIVGGSTAVQLMCILYTMKEGLPYIALQT